ncbi:hypothetical protein BLA29_013217, partial [Euroglyphus maynei]
MSFDDFVSSFFPSFKWLMTNRSNDVGHYLCQLIVRTSQNDSIGHIYDMIFGLNIKDDNDKSILLDAMLIIFIK